MLNRQRYRILFTSNSLDLRGGSELFVRDLAIALQKRGHHPVAYSTVIGAVAQDLRLHAVPVIDDLSALGAAPDVIHGHHHLDVIAATLAFPTTPIVFACHGWVPWEEMPLCLPTIQRYVAVSDLTREFLLTTPGIAPQRVALIQNFVDTERFARVRPAAAKLDKVLLFGNGWRPDHPHVAAILAACRHAGIGQVDVAGYQAPKSLERPEEVLPEYDLVFAVGRSAIEAMAVGCGVIVADAYGLGGLVTQANFTDLRDANFAYARTKGRLLTEATVVRELAAYDPDEAAAVTARTRTEASLVRTVELWEAQYAAALEAPAPPPDALAPAASAYLRKLKTVIWEIVANGHEHWRTAEENTSLARECLSLGEETGKLKSALAALQAQYDHLEARNDDLAAELRTIPSGLLAGAATRLQRQLQRQLQSRWQSLGRKLRQLVPRP